MTVRLNKEVSNSLMSNPFSASTYCELKNISRAGLECNVFFEEDRGSKWLIWMHVLSCWIAFIILSSPHWLPYLLPYLIESPPPIQLCPVSSHLNSTWHDSTILPLITIWMSPFCYSAFSGNPCLVSLIYYLIISYSFILIS